jgi:3-phosphoshikimate 1-carboxyvinyltransferase
VAVDAADFSRFQIPRRHYAATNYGVEPDASAASYFLAAAAVTGGEVRVSGLGRDSLQGDLRFCDCLERMGCEIRYERSRTTVVGRPLVGIEVDMNSISDTVQTLAAVALFANGPTTISGVGHIRHKETDRIGNLAIELRKLGATVDELSDGMRITPAALRGAQIETYNDHRMAMSLALVGLRVPGVVILDPQCTEKTYPGFFDDLLSLTRG